MPGALIQQLIQTASASRGFLEKDARRDVIGFIRSRRNPDGGFRGRDPESDLYYTLFAVAGLRALGGRIPLGSLWRYVRRFGDGADLDLVHLVCLIRLRTLFPIRRRQRQALHDRLEAHAADSAYDLFIRLIGEDLLCEALRPDAVLQETPRSPTTNLAAAIVVNGRCDDTVCKALHDRRRSDGGFAPTATAPTSDLLSTATALFSLRIACRPPNEDHCRRGLAYVESLWRDSGGFAGHAADRFEDVEYTFYALLTMGCLTDVSKKGPEAGPTPPGG